MTRARGRRIVSASGPSQRVDWSRWIDERVALFEGPEVPARTRAAAPGIVSPARRCRSSRRQRSRQVDMPLRRRWVGGKPWVTMSAGCSPHLSSHSSDLSCSLLRSPTIDFRTIELWRRRRHSPERHSKLGRPAIRQNVMTCLTRREDSSSFAELSLCALRTRGCAPSDGSGGIPTLVDLRCVAFYSE